MATVTNASATEEYDAGEAARAVIEKIEHREIGNRDTRRIGQELLRELMFKGYKLVRDKG